MTGPFSDRAPETSGIEEGVEWVVVRGPMVGFNGYAKIPDNHPWSDGIPNVPNMEYEYFESEAEKYLEVHGGITYNAPPWVGFDTAHSGDVWPAELDPKGLSGMFGPTSWDKHWTLELVVEETKNLARQIAHLKVSR